MTDIAKIAAGLSDAQMKCLLGDPNADMPANVALSFIDLKLIRPVLKDAFKTEAFEIEDVCMEWSNIGLAVRDHLREKNDG